MSDYYSIGAIAAVGLVGFISLFIAIKAKSGLRRCESEIEQLNIKVAELEYQRDMTSEGMHEIRSGTMGVSNRVKELTVQISQLADKIEELQLLDPDTRLYSQANKMVISGASVEELMEECSLPRAEAEMIFSMHKK